MDNCGLTKDILYVTTRERSNNYKWEKNADNLDPNVQIVSIDDIQKMDIDIFDRKYPVLDTILVKHPFIPNKYIPLDRTEDALTKTKLNCLGIIAGLLGVKEYETEFVTEEIKEVSINISGELDYKTVKSKTDVEIKKDDAITGKYYRHETFKGEFNEAGYNKAVSEAKKYGLYNDEDIQYLIKNRDPQSPNPLISQKVKFELTKELNDKLDFAFSLKAVSIFKLRANYNQIITQRKSIAISTNLIF